MFFLSKLIYDYHENKKFDLKINESIFNYINRINKSVDNGLNNPFFINIKNALIYIYTKYPNSFIYNYISNDTTDIQSGIIISNNDLSITFKGTDSLIDCYYDLYFIKRHIDLSNIEIHRGFFEQLMSIFDQLINNIKKLLLVNPFYNIYITGHSAGAAQGTIFSYLLANMYPNKIIKLITFGGPKIGNFDWYNAFNACKNIIHYRITNNSDIITKIPNFKYYHVGTNIKISTNSIYIYKDTYCCEDCCEDCCKNCDCENNNQQCCLKTILNHVNYLNISNHQIDSYYTNIINNESIWNETLLEYLENNKKIDIYIF
jgi:hypothetical protein